MERRPLSTSPPTARTSAALGESDLPDAAFAPSAQPRWQDRDVPRTALELLRLLAADSPAEQIEEKARALAADDGIRSANR